MDSLSCTVLTRLMYQLSGQNLRLREPLLCFADGDVILKGANCYEYYFVCILETTESSGSVGMGSKPVFMNTPKVIPVRENNWVHIVKN
jgi:hypothetical protein